ncbi:DUF2225 domain-containing protein [Cytobacillus gottheilii]|uniref:DUF2225 domain-containing protein n=1 Tax=Cytobacillus gottheilii TaxID=859144 RepID=UPI0009B9C87A|nr:DUF2225 domain-containing protein [Cytobacillus gottheilii]
MSLIEATYDKQYNCIKCQKAFTSKRMRSRFIKVDGYDSDFLPRYSAGSGNPLLYYIQTCPSCGFSFSEDFVSLFPPGTEDQIQKEICNRWAEKSYSGNRTTEEAISTYKLAIYCAILKQEKRITIAGLNMRLAWIYRLEDNEEQEQRFLKLAIDHYLASYTNEDFRGTKMSEIRLLYLIAELSRRTNQSEIAIQYFSKVLEQQKRSTEPKIIAMAREQWQTMRMKEKI